MKKKIVFGLFAFLLCFLLVGCGEKKEENKKENKEATWVFYSESKDIESEEDVQNVWNKATKDDNKYQKVTLLGTQVVAGTNYMFLAETSNSYKTLVIYKDLQGNVSITKVNDFDITKYAGKDISPNEQTDLSGGWNVEIPTKPNMVEDKINKSFEKATEKLVGVSYSPITTIAKNTKNSEYAVLSYGKTSDANGTTRLYVLTIDTENNVIKNIAVVELSDFNK